MRTMKWLILPLAGLAVWTVSAAAQQQARIIQVPFGRGVYYETPTGWVGLPMSVFAPTLVTDIKDFFRVGNRQVSQEMPGPHAKFGLNNSHPTFYMRGYRSGSQLYLVHLKQHKEYREARLSRTHHFTEWGRFHE